MVNATQIPVSEYLQTTYRPDREYVDGNLREKNVGKYEHSCLQALLAAWFLQHIQVWKAVPLTEQRVQVGPTRVRLPDITLVPMGPAPDVIIAPPLLIVEILSPDDGYADLQSRSRDYRTMGVETVWIIDPTTRTGRMCSGDAWTEASRLTAAGTEMYIDLPTLFANLDQLRA